MTNFPHVEILFGDAEHNDLPAIRHLFNGRPVFDARIDKVITAPDLKSLPPGTYRLTDPNNQQ